MSVIDDAPARASVRGVVRGVGRDPGVATKRRRKQPRAHAPVSPASCWSRPMPNQPSDWDGCTDWVRLPVDDRDLCARVAALQRLTSRMPEPSLDEFDVLWRGDRWVALAPIEARMLEVLLARCGTVVSRRELGSAAWPDGVPGTRAVDSRLRRLRDRVETARAADPHVRRRG